VFIFRWLNYQLLKMQWLSDLVQKFVEQVMGLSVQDRLGGSIHFFFPPVLPHNKNIVYLKNKKDRTSVKPQYTTLNYKSIQAVKQHLPDALVFIPG
jgi:hypothetical protein